MSVDILYTALKIKFSFATCDNGKVSVDSDSQAHDASAKLESLI